MVSDFGLSRDVYESGLYESTSGVIDTDLDLSVQLATRGKLLAI